MKHVDNREVGDELPEDLDRGFVGAYKFPNNKRRRLTGALYLAIAIAVGTGSILVPGDPVLVNA